MMAVVVILVVVAAGQGIFNLLRECHKEFELIDPNDNFQPLESFEAVETRKAA
jgi:hypothetical protein